MFPSNPQPQPQPKQPRRRTLIVHLTLLLFLQPSTIYPHSRTTVEAFLTPLPSRTIRKHHQQASSSTTAISPSSAWRFASTSSTTENDGLTPPPPTGDEGINNSKTTFLRSLDLPTRLNDATEHRTSLLNTLISTRTSTNTLPPPPTTNYRSTSTPSLSNPGRSDVFQSVAEGRWNVVYAPHMTTMARLAGGGEFRVTYLMNGDGSMESHARLDFPWLRWVGFDCVYLSVSGTYGSVDDNVCRVDFDQAWVRTIQQSTTDAPLQSDDDDDDGPYSYLSSVPDSSVKTMITRLGKLFFVEGVSVFPISFLDDDLIVFDFELLGTRICARKV